MIEISNLNKTYKIFQREPGVLQAFKSLFKRKYTTLKALDNIFFSYK